MAHDDRLDSQRAASFLTACFAVARAPVHTPTWTAPALGALEAAYGELPRLSVPTLVFDLMVLLQGERLEPVHLDAAPAVRDALRAYEDHVLARLTQDRRWSRLSDGVASAPKEARASAVALVVTQVLARLGGGDGAGVSQAVVRRLGSLPTEELLAQGRAALDEPETAARLVQGLEEVARLARRSREVLTDAEVFVVENVTSLTSLGARVALAQLATAAQLVEERLPTRLRGHVFEDGDAPTALEEESAFPVGGFASLATTGSLENLVTSELIYMDEEGAPRPDLFDVRFVEGELLYYARDESVAVRKRRRLVLVFDASLAAARVLDPKAGFQRLVWLLGAVTALVRKLVEWFDTEALTFELVFVQGADAPLTEELAVTSLVLREFRERGHVEVSEAASAAEACRIARERFGQRARAILFATRFPAGLEAQSEPDALVSLTAAIPDVAWRRGRVAETDSVETAADLWAGLTRRLLAGLLAPGRQR